MQDLASAEQVAARVRRLRREQDLSQQALASQAGIAMRTIANLEAGQDVSLDTLRKIAQALEVTVGYLVGAA